MTTEEKQARDAEVTHWRDENNKLREMYAMATERAEKAEAVVNAARELRQWCANGHGMYANAIKPICAAVDAYDAPAQEGE